MQDGHERNPSATPGRRPELQPFLFVVDGRNEKVWILERESLEVLRRYSDYSGHRQTATKSGWVEAGLVAFSTVTSSSSSTRL